MLKRSRAIIFTVTIASAAVLVPGQSASAHTTCSLGGSKTSTSTTAYANDCTSAQARIDRYIQNFPTSYYGSWGSTSRVSATSGVNSGNYVRANLHGEVNAWNRL
jgi:hypothetical protein